MLSLVNALSFTPGFNRVTNETPHHACRTVSNGFHLHRMENRGNGWGKISGNGASHPVETG